MLPLFFKLDQTNRFLAANLTWSSFFIVKNIKTVKNNSQGSHCKIFSKRQIFNTNTAFLKLQIWEILQQTKSNAIFCKKNILTNFSFNVVSFQAKPKPTDILLEIWSNLQRFLIVTKLLKSTELINKVTSARFLENDKLPTQSLVFFNCKFGTIFQQTKSSEKRS